MQKSSLNEAVVGWLTDFSETLARWEDWLVAVEQAYLTGEFDELTKLESTGLTIHEALAEAREDRKNLLLNANSVGLACNNLTRLCRLLGNKLPASTNLQLMRLTQQLQRVQQMSTALWVTGFQVSGYTTALLEILAMGSADRATYGNAERDVLEGGQIVDAAA